MTVAIVAASPRPAGPSPCGPSRTTELLPATPSSPHQCAAAVRQLLPELCTEMAA